MPKVPTRRVHRYNVLEYRKKAHLNQGEAATRAEMSVSYWCEIEKGVKQSVSYSVLRRMAEALEVSNPECLAYEAPETSQAAAA